MMAETTGIRHHNALCAETDRGVLDGVMYPVLRDPRCEKRQKLVEPVV